ncbi:formate/nitrite transporter family protein [Suttonella indologenes]|uniref:Formate channel 1 n=1 Tax=Suttonella indologenes TaxID=13276 RepID=A0A380MZX2_9GAMM|nr:formate/nitrite transporter family protein [Suttonella indologenes]SUO97576.1 Formate channel 1 [Suttonella indologenes]
MSDLYPAHILQATIDKGVAKARLDTIPMIVLGFLGGAFIALGYLAYIRLVGTMPHDWEGFSVFMGASVFPIGLICVLLGGGELITGNMMALPAAWFTRRISLAALCRNWGIVSAMNLLGAMAVAWFFGHYLGLTEGSVWEKTAAVAQSKVDADFFRALVSGIGCNWMVCMGVWLCYGASSFSGKILGIWFPVMIFVLIGFQHVVANMFVIPAAIWGGAAISWGEFIANMIAVYIGNVIGGAVFMAGAYVMAYPQSPH